MLPKARREASRIAAAQRAKTLNTGDPLSDLLRERSRDRAVSLADEIRLAADHPPVCGADVVERFLYSLQDYEDLLAKIGVHLSNPEVVGATIVFEPDALKWLGVRGKAEGRKEFSYGSENRVGLFLG